MNDYLVLLLGVVCAGIGGEAFIRGAVGIARATRVSPAIIGATVAAFATSSPELAVGVRAACTFPARDGRIGRRRGVLLLLLYGLYLALLFQTHSA